MHSETYVKEQIEKMKKKGTDLQIVAWKTAKNCVGWPYVYGAVGEECKPAKRAQYGTKFYQKDHTTIVTKCKAISWDKESQTCKVTGNCSGCQWNLPVLMFDCRGFTRKILAMVYSFTLWGGTVGGQWKDERNWKAKGEIATMPKDTICCLFVYKNSKWQHTGFGFNNETVECSSGVQYFSTRNKKWTHWAVPKCVDGDIPDPQPTPPVPDPDPKKRPTLRRGDKGPYVKLAQTELIGKGFDCGKTGADGDFGKNTEAAVKSFQKANGLKVDGIIGPQTWAALDAETEPAPEPAPEPVQEAYTVTIPGLTKEQAEKLCAEWSEAEMKRG